MPEAVIVSALRTPIGTANGALHDTDAYALCSLGHPVAASGARMLVTLVHELRRR
jgi:acetyl-CoA acetyltransferase